MQVWRVLIVLVLTGGLGIAQENTTARPTESSGTATPSELSPEQIRDLIRLSSDKDVENDKKLRDYTYVERQEDAASRRQGTGEVNGDRRPTTSWKSMASRCRS